MAVVKPAVHQRADVVAPVAVDIDESCLRKQTVQIRNAHDVNACLVQDPSQAQPLEEITLRRIAVLGSGDVCARRLGFPPIAPRAPQTVPEFRDLVTERQELRRHRNRFVGNRRARARAAHDEDRIAGVGAHQIPVEASQREVHRAQVLGPDAGIQELVQVAQSRHRDHERPPRPDCQIDVSVDPIHESAPREISCPRPRPQADAIQNAGRQADEPGDCLLKNFLVIPTEKTGFPINDALAEAASISGENSLTACHRLESNQAPIFIQRGDDGCVAPLVKTQEFAIIRRLDEGKVFRICTDRRRIPPPMRPTGSILGLS